MLQLGICTKRVYNLCIVSGLILVLVFQSGYSQKAMLTGPVKEVGFLSYEPVNGGPCLQIKFIYRSEIEETVILRKGFFINAIITEYKIIGYKRLNKIYTDSELGPDMLSRIKLENCGVSFTLHVLNQKWYENLRYAMHVGSSFKIPMSGQCPSSIDCDVYKKIVQEDASSVLNSTIISNCKIDLAYYSDDKSKFSAKATESEIIGKLMKIETAAKGKAQ
jgi:hypothetical protein